MTETAAILLFTTDTLPFALHNINILSFPQGLSYRFRYEKSHISSSLTDLTALGLDKKKIIGYVVFQFADGTYFPYRKIELIRSYDYGNLVFFNAELKGLVDSSSNSLPAITEYLNTLIEERELPPKKLVHQINLLDDKFSVIEDRDDRSNRVWSNCVNILSEAENLRALSFLRFDILEGIKEQKRYFPSGLSGDMRGYRLRPGKDYLIRFFEYTSLQPPGIDKSTRMFSISLKGDANKIDKVKPEEMVDGTYDMFDLLFSTLPEASSDTAYLRIENTQNKDDKRIPTLYIPYCVSLNPIWKAIRPILLLISIIAFIDPPLITWIISGALGVFPKVRDVLAGISSHFDKEKWIQVLAIFLFVFSFWNFSFRSALKNIKDLLK